MSDDRDERCANANRCAAWLLLACATGVVAQTPAAPIDVAISDVRVVDVERGRASAPQTVLVAGGRIVAIEPGPTTAPAHALLHVDGRGRYLVPGLIDAHVHLFNNHSMRAPNDWAFALFVANGVTGVREMAANPSDLAQVRRWNAASRAGQLLAPQVLATAVRMSGRSRSEIAARIAEADAAGAQFAKVFSDLGETTWDAVVTAAAARSLPIAGHTPAATALLVAAHEGLRSNEHLMQAYEACSSREDEWLGARAGLSGEALAAKRDAQELLVLDSFDARRCARVAQMLVHLGQVQVPTLVLAYNDAHPATTAVEADARWLLLRADERARWLRHLVPSALPEAPLAQRRWAVTQEIVTAFHADGVGILAGSDAPMPRVYPGFSLHEELELLVAAGLQPAQALRAATLAPARFFGVADELGSIAVGKRADLVLLDADPLREIGNTRRISVVLLGGRVLRRAQLDSLLDANADAR